MISYKFTKVSRAALTQIVHDAITALADKENFDTFTLTLDTDCNESDVEVIKHPRFGCATDIKINDEMDDVSNWAKDAVKKVKEAK